MGRKAFKLEEQIRLLKSRGLIINNVEKSKEVLLDVGYYRLGFYWFPFEKTYPKLENRSHEFKENSSFDDAVKLYYFDFNLRNILHKVLSRIEIAVRTYMTYSVSNVYDCHPTWFADPAIVSKGYVKTFPIKVYNDTFKRIPEIARHHRKYLNDVYAPAWKTIENMTMGAMLALYKAILDKKLKIDISKHFGINFPEVFENYMELLRNLRNTCAHGRVLDDFRPEHSIRKGPALMSGVGRNQNLNGAIHIVLYLIKQISVNRYNEYKAEIEDLIEKYGAFPAVRGILEEVSGLRLSQLFAR